MLKLLKFIIVCLVTISSAFAQNSHSNDEIQTRVNKDYAYLDQLYKHLHSNPEISLQEEKTAKKLTDELTKLGFKVTQNIGGHGFVGILKNGDGPTVMIRTDLDGLPVEENTGLDYASKARTIDPQGNDVGVMHACGHDVHMTVFVGTARMLTGLKDKWKGTLVMIGQPAEEIGTGAKAMLDEGLFEKFPRPDYCLALHSNSVIPAGKVGVCEGFALANVDFVDIKVHGKGGHGAYPHTTKDPVVLAAQIVLALQTIVSREIKPVEPAVVTVGAIHGGTKHNIIGDEVDLQLTLRSYSEAVRNQTIESIKRICNGLAQAAGLSDEDFPIIKVRDGFTPATYNDPELTRHAAKVMREALGDENVITVEPVMGGEDFGRFGQVEPKIPIHIFWLGTVAPEKFEASLKSGQSLPSLHSNLFAPLPEPTLKTGVKAMTVSALSLFKE